MKLCSLRRFHWSWFCEIFLGTHYFIKRNPPKNTKKNFFEVLAPVNRGGSEHWLTSSIRTMMRPINFAEFSWILLNFLEFSWTSTKDAILWVLWCFVLIFAIYEKWVTDPRTHRPMDERTDKASYRDAWTHLKKNGFIVYLWKGQHIAAIHWNKYTTKIGTLFQIINCGLG